MFLRLHKEFLTPTSRVLTEDAREGERQFFQDVLDTVLEVPERRPLRVARQPLDAAAGRAGPGQARERRPEPAGDLLGRRRASPASPASSSRLGRPRLLQRPSVHRPRRAAGIDNAKVNVRIDWPTLASDWDMQIFRDTNGDGLSDGETEEVGSSAQGTDRLRVLDLRRADPDPGQLRGAGHQLPRRRALRRDDHLLRPRALRGRSRRVLAAHLRAARRATCSAACRSRSGAARPRTTTSTRCCRDLAGRMQEGVQDDPDIKGDAEGRQDQGHERNRRDRRAGRQRQGQGGRRHRHHLPRTRPRRGQRGRRRRHRDRRRGRATSRRAAKGDDQLFGNRSRDSLVGGPGRDRCSGGPASDETKSCK